MVLGFFFCIGKAAADTDIFHEGNMVTYLYLWIQREAMVGGFRMKAESKRFYHGLASLVIPITIQNFITNAVNSADVFMLGYV